MEYTLETFELENSALSDEDLAAVEEAGKIEDLVKLPTPEEQEAFIKNYILGDEEENVPDDVKNEFDDDIPQ